MDDLRVRLRIILLFVLPLVLAITAWGWWWLPITVVIMVITGLLPGVYFVRVSLAVLGGIALQAVAPLFGLPGATLIAGFLYPIIYWVICVIVG